MSHPRTIKKTSYLKEGPGRVWAHATSMEGINRELGPWLRMTWPPAVDGLTLDALATASHDGYRLGAPLFSSWILLLGVLPVERMRVTIIEIESGRRFVEQSPMLFLRYWRHERSVEPAGDGCRVCDRVTFAPRLGWLAGPLARLLAAFFAHRHQTLMRLFG